MPKQRRKTVRDSPPAESRVADFCTIGWLLSTLTTLFCETVSLAAARYAGDAPEQTGLRVFSGYMLFAALATGLPALALTAVAWKVRRVPPPPGITVFSLVVSVVPWLVLLFRQGQ